MNCEGFDSVKLFEDFFELAYMSKLNLQDLYRLYIGKNILNQFRQDNGYKEGTYVKVWDGKEDNIVVPELWEENASLTPKVLYRALQKAYQLFLNRSFRLGFNPGPLDRMYKK